MNFLNSLGKLQPTEKSKPQQDDIDMQKEIQRRKKNEALSIIGNKVEKSEVIKELTQNKLEREKNK